MFELIFLFRMIVAKIQQLSMLQIEHLHIPFSEEEEQLVASIPSYVNRRIKSFLVRKIFFSLDNSNNIG